MTVVADQVAHKSFTLSLLPVTLDSIIARAERPGLSASMRQLELRRATGMGRFLIAEDLRAMEHRNLASIVATFGGARVVHYKGYSFLASSRGPMGIGRKLPRALVTEGRGPTGCWVQVYLDGVRIYAPFANGDAPDLRSFPASQLEAVEYYRGPAETPEELNTLGNACGTLVLWTRQK